MKARISFVVVVVCVVFGVSLVQADTFFKYKKHTDPFTMMGQNQPAKDETAIMWMGKNRFRNDVTEGQTVIMRADQKKMYMLSHNEKAYNVVDLPFDPNKMIPSEDKEMAGQMMQMFKMTCTVTDTGETKKIGQWKCNKYLMVMQGMMGASTEMWTTKDIKIDYSAYETFADTIMGMNPMFKDMLEEMKKVQGLKVYSVTTVNMMGAKLKTTEELVEVSERAAPAGTYDVPSGYKKVDFNPMAGQGGGAGGQDFD